jgi:hypothetical protein
MNIQRNKWVAGMVWVGALLSSACMGYSDDAGEDTLGSEAELRGDVTGNGSPGGLTFQVNLIGVPKNKKADLSNNDGRRIFIPLDGTTKILLQEGDFAVLDANATDGSGSFQLPSPDADGDGVTEYSVFARALGKPGGSVRITTCGVDADGLEVCSTESSVLVRGTGKSRFENVSRELLFVFADLDGDGAVERIPLFDDRLEGFLWNVDDTGLKLAQLRFVEVPTDVNQ